MKRLNKFLKKHLIESVMFNNASVNLIGNEDFYIIVVRNKRGILFEYKHKKDIDTVMVGKDVVAQYNSNALSTDMQELLNVLTNTIENKRELERIETDRQNITPDEMLALTRLNELAR